MKKLAIIAVSLLFDKPKALDIDLTWRNQPEGDICGWGGEANAVGAIRATPQQVYDWFQEYGK